jgi:hypothetical protein
LRREIGEEEGVGAGGEKGSARKSQLSREKKGCRKILLSIGLEQSGGSREAVEARIKRANLSLGSVEREEAMGMATRSLRRRDVLMCWLRGIVMERRI